MTNEYKMKISRLTVDKLGVKLYDKVSAVIAELISNSYDADSTTVNVEIPVNKYLAKKENGQIIDSNFEIRVIDNGIGMDPAEVNKYYLKVGAERRTENAPGRGDLSPNFRRRVMGRKGVGKLAPFGICEEIEVITSGGRKITDSTSTGETQSGYRIAHFIMNRNDILQDSDHDYIAKPGNLDNTLKASTGTTIILRNFSYRRVSNLKTFSRQLAQRFGLSSSDWKITIHDNKTQDNEGKHIVGSFEIETMENSKIRFQGPDGPNLSTDPENKERYKMIAPEGSTNTGVPSAGFLHDERFYPVTGWVAYARQSYRDDLMAGIRIYCRGKIAAQTAVFNRKAGFQGENSVRSYLVGELHADWLDESDDLIQTDRRDILWSDEIGQEFQKWGQKVVESVGRIARDPARKRTWEIFLEISHFEERLTQMFPGKEQESIRENAKKLAKSIGQTIRADEVRNSEVINPIVELSLEMAPHVTLDETLRKAADKEHTPIAAMNQILKTARLAELSSFGGIAAKRIKVIERVRILKNDAMTAESQLQNLLECAPWLINPEWAPITANQTFNTLKQELERKLSKALGKSVNLADTLHPTKRPDFVLSNQDRGLQIIEIKRPGHSLSNEEMDRIIVYKRTIDKFLQESKEHGYGRHYNKATITVICDEISVTGAQEDSYNYHVDKGCLIRIRWEDFLLKTMRMHRDFLKEAEKQKRYAIEQG